MITYATLIINAGWTQSPIEKHNECTVNYADPALGLQLTSRWNNLQDVLTQIGENGWQMCGVYNSTHAFTGSITYHFMKRA